MNEPLYSPSNLASVLTTLEAIEKISLYSAEFATAEEFFEANDQLNFNACNTLLLVITEEVGKLEHGLLSMFPAISWKQIRGLRNRLAHDYRGTDPNIAFEIIRDYLPDLKTALIPMLDYVSFEPEMLEAALHSSFYRHLGYLASKLP
jgi:uncharacterized protein with HEPN domain